MGKIIRPKIDSDIVREIKQKYPSETALLDQTATLNWALRRFLQIEEIRVEQGGA